MYSNGGDGASSGAEPFFKRRKRQLPEVQLLGRSLGPPVKARAFGMTLAYISHF
jgi:hypothetical protein